MLGQWGFQVEGNLGSVDGDGRRKFMSNASANKHMDQKGLGIKSLLTTYVQLYDKELKEGVELLPRVLPSGAHFAVKTWWWMTIKWQLFASMSLTPSKLTMAAAETSPEVEMEAVTVKWSATTAAREATLQETALSLGGPTRATIVKAIAVMAIGTIATVMEEVKVPIMMAMATPGRVVVAATSSIKIGATLGLLLGAALHLVRTVLKPWAVRVAPVFGVQSVVFGTRPTRPMPTSIALLAA
jgi:hypothetical protein